MLMFTGVAMLAPSLAYSSFLHLKKLRTKPHEVTTINTVAIWAMLTLIPLSIVFQSTFLGYATFSIIFTFLGFRMRFFGLGIGLGWENDAAMETSALSAGIIVGLFAIIKSSGIRSHYLAPFASAIQILGGNIIYLANLIRSSEYYRWNSRYFYTFRNF